MRILWQSYTGTGNSYLGLLQRALQDLAGDNVEVVVAGLDQPHVHIHRLSEARCAYQVVAANLDAEQRGFDAVVVGHFQDGGVHELRSALGIPVVGLGEASMHHAMMLGDGFGLVTINPGFIAFHRDQVHRYHLDAKFVGVRAMNTDAETFFAAFSGDEKKRDCVVEQFAEQASNLVNAGADVILPAGGLPALLLFGGGHIPDLDNAAVLDPLGIALGQAEIWARLGKARLSPGRRGMFAQTNPSVLGDYVSSLRTPNRLEVSNKEETSK